MAYTPNLGIEKLTPGQSSAHVTVNEAMDNFDRAIAGAYSFTGGGAVTLTGGQSTNHLLICTSASSATTVTIQAVPKTWIAINRSAHSLSFKTPGQATPVTIASGAVRHIACDGTDIVLVA